MADTGSAGELRGASTSRNPGRGPNVSGGWVAMVLSGLIAAVLFFFITQTTSQRVLVATFSQDMIAGQAITPDSFGRTEVGADDAMLNRMVRWEDRGSMNGRVVNGPEKAGDPVIRSSLLEPASVTGRRSMSIPIDKAHANGGDLRAGDRVDVIDPASSAGYVARGVEVLGVRDTSSGGLGAVQSFIVVVAVDEGQAFGIARTVNTGKIDLIRSTGATPSTGSTGTTAPATGTAGGGAGSTTTTSSSTTTTTADVGA